MREHGGNEAIVGRGGGYFHWIDDLDAAPPDSEEPASTGLFDAAGYLRASVEDCWNHGDLAGFMAAFANDAELWPQAAYPDGGPVIRTKPEIERFFASIHRPVELGPMELVGDEVLGSFRWSGGPPDAGYDWTLLYRFDGPHVVRARYYADAGHARRAVGEQ